uniref:Uncharacterized protein n=1 Tax=Micrurus lemniscatus lemniscatus TaxID=129467 RepID=A0A2D4J8U7_MICLE
MACIGSISKQMQNTFYVAASGSWKLLLLNARKAYQKPIPHHHHPPALYYSVESSWSSYETKDPIQTLSWLIRLVTERKAVSISEGLLERKGQHSVQSLLVVLAAFPSPGPSGGVGLQLSEYLASAWW